LPGLTLEVNDRDVGKNAEYRLFLEPVSPNMAADIFSVYPLTAIGKSPVTIRVQNPARLDYEDPAAGRQFVFNVVAEPVGGSSGGSVVRSEITVVVTDSNDNAPRFVDPETATLLGGGGGGGYEFVVPENAAPSTILGQIRAADPDSGSFGEVTYSLKGFGAEKFTVDPVSGEVAVAACGDSEEVVVTSSSSPSCLDYESQASYSLTYTATDGGGQTVTTGLTVRLEDVNDNHPQFEQAAYRRVVREGESVFEPPLVIHATDKDGGGGSAAAAGVFYTIRSINTDATVFVIDPMTGELTMTKPVRVEDTENGRYDLVVRATDQGRPEPLYTDVEVFVSVGRTRNQRPRFAQPRQEVTIPENAVAGDILIQMKAEDPDGPDTDLRYLIHDGSKDNFLIDPTTGVISVAPGAILDIQQNGDMYELEVRAVDKGEPHPQLGSTLVAVTIRDINDKPPRFSQAAYTEYVVENEPAGHEVLTVIATDPDRNAELEFDIIEPITARDKSGSALESTASADYDFKAAFSIDPATGKITINEKLSYNLAAVIILTLQVRDRKAEVNAETQVAIAEATFYIQAFNADSPVFPAPWTPSDPRIRVNVSEELPPGTPLFNLGARDPLTGQAVTNYQKLAASPGGGEPSASADIIQVSQYGDVISSQRLDYETVKSITFSVAAMAGGGGAGGLEERTSDVHVTLHLVDVNDNAPVFELPANGGGYMAEIPEDILPLGLVTTVRALDADSGEFGEVIYSLEGEGVAEFMIHETEGHIQVNGG
jgi:hypothetical protein